MQQGEVVPLGGAQHAGLATLPPSPPPSALLAGSQNINQSLHVEGGIKVLWSLRLLVSSFSLQFLSPS